MSRFINTAAIVAVFSAMAMTSSAHAGSFLQPSATPASIAAPPLIFPERRLTPPVKPPVAVLPIIVAPYHFPSTYGRPSFGRDLSPPTIAPIGNPAYLIAPNGFASLPSVWNYGASTQSLIRWELLPR